MLSVEGLVHDLPPWTAVSQMATERYLVEDTTKLGALRRLATRD